LNSLSFPRRVLHSLVGNVDGSKMHLDISMGDVWHFLHFVLSGCEIKGAVIISELKGLFVFIGNI
jgi:hypothetical protein